MTDLLIAAALLTGTAGAAAAGYLKAASSRNVEVEEEYATYPEALEAMKLYMVERTKEDSIYSNMTDDEMKRRKKLKAQEKNAIKMAPNGVRDAKLMVKGMIRTWVLLNLPMERVRQFLGIDEESEPTHNIMFEILMYRYQKEYKQDAFSAWMDKNHFADPKPAVGIVRRGAQAYYVTKSELENSYYAEDIELSDEEAVDVLVTKMYSDYLGWGPFDTLGEMNINGYNIGVSGALVNNMKLDNDKNPDAISEATNSLWVYYRSNYIHLQFIEFGNLAEISRITQLLIRWGNPGPLTKKNGYKINTMHDQSRILAIRPDAGESWGVFVRKLALDFKSPEELIIKKGYKNAEVAAKLIEYLMVAQITIAVTGRQGSGKTTLMKAIMGYLPPDWNLRVLEAAPELYLRETYPNREIYSVQETATLSMEELQDAFKKSDATVTIIGEVATDPVSARMIQLAMTGSLMTIFSHHANTAKDLVLTLRNSLVNAGGFSNMQTAEKQVTDVLKLNIHLGFEEGYRFIKRITEIYQFEEGVPYPEYDPSDPAKSTYDLQKEYYYRQTDRISFDSHDVLYFDLENKEYKIGEHFSDYLYHRIYEALPAADKKGFNQFVSWYWDGISIDGYEGIESEKVNRYDNEVDNMVYSEHEAEKFLDDAFGDYRME